MVKVIMIAFNLRYIMFTAANLAKTNAFHAVHI